MLEPRACLTIDDIEIGMTFEREYTVTEDMTKAFSEVTGDWNPAHHDAEYARKTVFRRPIAHGMMSVCQFSTIFGMDMPGLGVIWMSQNVEFLAPVYLNKPHKAVAIAVEKHEDTKAVTFTTECFDENGKKVLTGTGMLKPIPAKVKAKMGL